MKKILITVDGSVYSKRAIGKGKEIAKAFNSEITLLNVRNSFIPYLALEESEKFIHAIKENSEMILEESKKYLLDIDNDIQLVSLQGDIASTIIEYISENDFDLVVMGSQGLNAGKIKGLLIGSTTSKIIHNVKKPVLVVK